MLASPSPEREPSGWPFWLAVGAGLALRLLWLDVRPLHHDEGVNGWFLVRLLDGYRYEYDPEQFHGPFLYFFGAPWTLLLGMGETVLRLPVALASASLPLLLLPLRSRMGMPAVTAAAWLLAVSPTLVYYGRDLIHETYLVVLTLALVAAASRWLEGGRERDLLLAALALGLMLTVKETAVLTLAVFAAAGLAAWLAAGRGRLDLPLPSGRGGGASRTLALVLLALAVPYVLLYTSFFTHPAGLVDSFRAYLPWTEKGFEGSGHEKPWDYFLRLLLAFEAPALAAAALGSAMAVRRRDPFGIFCAAWWLGQLAAYSAIPYKTPWLVMNVVLPLALGAGMLFRQLGPLPGRARAVLATACLLAVAWTGWRAVDVSFRRYDDEGLGLVYVQSPRELRDLIALIEEAAARSGEGKGIAIRFYTANRWPLPWYLRDYTNVLWGEEIPGDPSGDVLVCDPTLEEELRSRLPGKYERREITLRPRVKLVVLVLAGEGRDE